MSSASLHISLTTFQKGGGKLATMRRKPSGATLVEIYAKRQVRRPHYLAALMKRYGVSRAELIEATGVDKSLLSRWLDEERPTTPSPDWAAKLGEFFGKGHDPVDIFADPDVDWIAKKLRNRSEEEKERILAMIDAAFPEKKAHQ